MIRLLDRLRRRAATPAAPETPPDVPWRSDYDDRATREDILACFRLLLGRYPHAEEWTGHLMHQGEPLPQVVASYLTSLEFARRNLMRDIPPDLVISDLPAFRIVSDRNDSAVGKFVREDAYEHNVTAVFRQLLRPGMAVLDIGANIGYFALLSAAIVGASGRVFAVEPNQQNARLLEASRRLNGFTQLSLIAIAAAARTGILALTTSHSTGTTSTIPEEVDAVLSSRIVPAAALDDLLDTGQKIDLIKIDVDGAEYPAMLGCEKIITRDKPAIISEFAPDLLPGISGVSGEAYLRWFGALGYEVAVIQPDGSLQPCGQQWEQVMLAYRASGIDHIDILASPLPM